MSEVPVYISLQTLQPNPRTRAGERVYAARLSLSALSERGEGGAFEPFFPSASTENALDSFRSD